MKTLFLLLFGLTAGRAMAQSALAARQPGGNLQVINSQRVIFSYRSGLYMNHDTVI